jgi:hypothetical protein
MVQDHCDFMRQGIMEELETRINEENQRRVINNERRNN